MKHILGLLAMFGLLAACGEENPVRKAINEGSFDITIADYKAGTVEDRQEFLALYISASDLSAADLPLYVACMGDYAGTKAETLAFTNVFSWCQGDAERDRAAFEDHFNELDAKDLSFEASTMCQQIVTSRLTSPSTADFGGWLRADNGRWRYLSSGHVDAQNGFGATVRARFACDLQYHGPSDYGEYMRASNWTVHDVSISQ